MYILFFNKKQDSSTEPQYFVFINSTEAFGLGKLHSQKNILLKTIMLTDFLQKQCYIVNNISDLIF